MNATWGAVSAPGPKQKALQAVSAPSPTPKSTSKRVLLATGTLYPESAATPVLSKYALYEEQIEGQRVLHALWTDPRQESVQVEEFVYFQGRQFSKYTVSQKQVREEAVVEVRTEAKPEGSTEKPETKLWFSLTDRNGKTTTDDEVLRPHSLPLPLLGDFIREQGPSLQSGKDLDARFIVVSRKETVGLSLSWAGSTAWDPRQLEVETLDGKSPTTGATLYGHITMKATSWFLKIFVKHLDLVVSLSPPYRLKAVYGRMPVKELTDPARDDWSDYFGRLILEPGNQDQ